MVHGLFADGEQAVSTLEALRTARFDTNKVRLVAGPRHAAEFGASASMAGSVAAGPSDAIVGGLLEAQVSTDEQRAIEKRLDEGAVMLIADDLDDAAAEQLSGILRSHGADEVRTQTT